MVSWRRLAAGLTFLGGLALAHPAATFGWDDFGRTKANEPLFEPQGVPITDAERELKGRLWRFLTTPSRVADFFGADWELPHGVTTKPDRYYLWLKGVRYDSPVGRYNQLQDDVAADLDALPATFAAICAVSELDRQRGASMQGIDDAEPALLRRVQARVSDNTLAIAHFAAQLQARQVAYNYALDHLLVETPDKRAVAIDADVSELAGWGERATVGDFCDANTGRPAMQARAALPSRVLLDRDPTKPAN